MRWRIGLVISVVWLLGVLGYGLWQREERDALYGDAVYGSCIVLEERRVKEEPGYRPSYSECSKERSEFLSKMPPMNWLAFLAVGLTPFVSWLLVFGLVAWLRPRARS